MRDLKPQDIRAQATADGQVVVVTDTVLRVGSGNRVDLDVTISDIRRIQFDIERDRPATLVIVPISPHHQPQVIVVQPEEYAAVGEALVILGRLMAVRRPG
jgi:hypothetical protein